MKHDLVVKHNTLVEAMTDMTLQQQRILGFIISRLPKKTEVPTDRPYAMEVPVAEFAEDYGISLKNAYREIERNQDTFQTKIIQLRENDARTKLAILISATYHDNEGRIEIEIHNKLMPYLVNLKERFTTYRIRDVYQFTSANTWRVYELLAQFRQAGKREMSLDEIRWALGVAGKYKTPTDLKRWVVEPAIKEINGKSDLAVQYNTMKRGRKVTGYRFHIRTKSAEQFEKDMKQPAEQEERTPEVKEMIPLLMGYGVGGKQAGQLADTLFKQGKNLNWLQSKLPKMQADFNKLQDQKTNLGGYIYKALKKELSGQLQMPIQPEASDQADQTIKQAMSGMDKDSGPAKIGWESLAESDKQYYRVLARGELERIYPDPPESQIDARAKHIFEGKYGGQNGQRTAESI